jgi:hypothetical protein
MICKQCGKDKDSKTQWRTEKGKRIGLICKECVNRNRVLWFHRDDEGYLMRKEKERSKLQRLRALYPERYKMYEKKYQHRINRIISTYKKNAKSRKREYKLKDEIFHRYWQANCFYCGDKLETIGLDRIDNTKGYTEDNIVPCCTICNRMRMALTQKDFIDKCKKIAKNFPDPQQDEFVKDKINTKRAE